MRLRDWPGPCWDAGEQSADVVDILNSRHEEGLGPIAFLSMVVGLVALGAVVHPIGTSSDHRAMAAQAFDQAVADGTRFLNLGHSSDTSDADESPSETVPAYGSARVPKERLTPNVRPLDQVIVIPGPRMEDSIPLRQTPQSDASQLDQPIIKAIDPSARYLASSEPVRFADDDDYTGGRDSLWAEYARARSRDREERAYATVVLAKGDTVAQTIEAVGAKPEEVEGLLAAANEISPIENIKSGAAIDYAFDTIFTEAPIPEIPSDGSFTLESLPDAGEPIATEVLARIRFRPDRQHVVTAWRQLDGTYTARIEELKVQKRYAAVAGVIRSSLFAAAAKSDVPPEIMSRFANLFLYDVDFARDIQPGDRYEAVYEVFFDEQGQYAGTGDIVFAGMSWDRNRQSKGYYFFPEATEMEIRYFDHAGESANRLLMKTPIEGARITSRFGQRRHPILGYTKNHKGVDFGARHGTPIMAAGDGVIQRADRFGSFGNYVRIKHAHGYETAYAHLQGFAPGIKAGEKVLQGDIIGYVGTTGRSTGPHLHYEVLKDGKVQNPMTIKVAGGRVLDESHDQLFEDRIDYIDTIRVRPLTVATATNQ